MIAQERLLLLTDPRNTDQASREASDYEIVEVRTGIAAGLRPLVAELRLQKLGFESNHLPFQIVKQIGEALGESATFNETVGLVDELRVIKDETELTNIRVAAAIADACMDHLLGWLRPGLTEKEVAWRAESFMRSHGADDLAFNPIVASGPNAAMPHGAPTNRRLAQGESIILDVGARVDRYCSDITRTVCLGRAPEWLRLVYGIVREAQGRAEDLVRPGMTGKQANALARSRIAEAGYGERFRHSLGHGIGLEPHERPSLSERSDELLVAGMIFSVEPGIYLCGVGGARIEDLIRLGADGAEVLTRAGKDHRLLEI